MFPYILFPVKGSFPQSTISRVCVQRNVETVTDLKMKCKINSHDEHITMKKVLDISFLWGGEGKFVYTQSLERGEVQYRKTRSKIT